MIGKSKQKAIVLHKTLYWMLNKMPHILYVLAWFLYCQKGHLITFFENGIIHQFTPYKTQVTTTFGILYPFSLVHPVNLPMDIDIEVK